jgi:hypothetical protein
MICSSMIADHVFKVDGVDRSVRTYGWDPRNSTIKSVCHECNNGWMSSLDSAGKPVLSLLIKGEAAFLDADSQKLIATWVAMKTMVGEFFDPVKAAVPLSERQFLRDRRQPPDNWIIWIGNYTRDKWAGEWVHTAIGIDSKVLRDEIPKSRIRKPRRLSSESFTLMYSAAKFPIS